jgi:hypothetical protein
MVMSSTITTIENINEYILYILSILDVQSSIVNSASEVTRTFDLGAANTAIENDNIFLEVETQNTMLTEVNIDNKEYVVIVEDTGANLSNLFVTSSTNIELDLNANNVIQTETYLPVWKLIQGTISFSNSLSTYSSTQISVYANVQIAALQSATFLSSPNRVTGIGTNLLLDFAVNDLFLANNEFGKVSVLFSNTEMDIYVPPSSAYTNVPAYKIIAGP